MHRYVLKIYFTPAYSTPSEMNFSFPKSIVTPVRFSIKLTLLMLLIELQFKNGVELLITPHEFLNTMSERIIKRELSIGVGSQFKTRLTNSISSHSVGRQMDLLDRVQILVNLTINKYTMISAFQMTETCQSPDTNQNT